MSDAHWMTLVTVRDRIEAEIIKGALEAQEITAEIFQEGIMHYAFLAGGIQVCVSSDQIDVARQWLAEYQAAESTEQEEMLDEELSDEPEE